MSASRLRNLLLQPKSIRDASPSCTFISLFLEADFYSCINCLFVHDWQEIKLKEPAKPAEAASKQPDDDNEEDEPDNFNFEDMLMNLGELKSKAASLSFEERKKYAEDIVLKFWETMGGDESEIAELD